MYRYRFLIARHGESIWNKDSKFTGWTNIPLTEKGKSEAKSMANALKCHGFYPDIVFSSVLDRAIHTATIVREALETPDVQIHTSWRLNEKHYGTLEGVPRNHVRDLFGDRFTQLMRRDFYMKPPIIDASSVTPHTPYSVYRNCYFESIQRGESKENVLQRLLPYYENDIVYTIYHENRFPLIITHKHTARVLMKHLLRMSDEAFEKYDLPNHTVLCVDLDERQKYMSHMHISYTS